MMENTQLNYDAIVGTIKNQIEALKQEIINSDIYAPIYSPKASYVVGNYVWYDDDLYRCTINTSGTESDPEAFDETKWDLVTDPLILQQYNNFYATISPLIGTLNFYVALEQEFIKSNEKIDPYGVYVAVRFSKAVVNFGSSVCNVSLVILGTANKVKPTQMFFSAFASKYNLSSFQGNTNSQQIWVTPSVQNNFNDFATDFRNLYEVSGTLIIGNKTIDIVSGVIVYKYGDSGESENIPFMSFQDSYRNNLAPQPYGNTYGFSKSETNFSTITYTLSTYLLDSQLVADCMHARGYKLPTGVNGRASTKQPNDKFFLIVNYSNGYTNYDPSDQNENGFFATFSLVDCVIRKDIGDIPMFTASFTH